MRDWLVAFKSHDPGGILFINTICVHYEPLGGVGDDLTASQTASQVRDWLSTPYRTALSSANVLDEIDVRSAPAGSSEAGVQAVGLAGLASGVGDLPHQLAVILSFKTGHATRRGRGHIAYPGNKSESAYTGGLFSTSTAWWTAIDTLTAALLAGHDVGAFGLSGHLSHRVWSRVDQASYDVTSIIKRTSPRWVERRQTAP